MSKSSVVTVRDARGRPPSASAGDAVVAETIDVDTTGASSWSI